MIIQKQISSETSTTKASHLPILDVLRGVAAFSVCMYHFAVGNSEFLPPDDGLKSLSSYGRLGVEMFFVISGFVIPYSLSLREYQLKDGISFFIRRLKRLEPPYFACIILAIAIHQISSLAPNYQGTPIDLSWQRLLAHIAYLNAILKYDWINPIFWTLAIEFQYYIFIAFVYPLLSHQNKLIRGLSTVTIAMIGFGSFGNMSILPFWLPLFAIGMSTFQLYTHEIRLAPYILVTSVNTAVSYYVIGAPETVAGLGTAITILLFSKTEISPILKPLAFLGTISYSLYLLHIPIGQRLINLANRLPENTSYRYSAFFLALVLSIVSAYIFWRFVELPSQQWSKSRWRRKENTDATT